MKYILFALLALCLIGAAIYEGDKLITSNPSINYGWHPPAPAEKHLYGDDQDLTLRQAAPELFDNSKGE